MKLSMIATQAVEGLKNLLDFSSLNKDEKQEVSNKLHLDDLQHRLQSIANNAKKKKKNIGSTLPYEERAKRACEKQFFGDIMEDGRHRFFVQDGQLVSRVSNV